MRSEARTPEEYVESLPEDRREAIAAVRAVILEHHVGEAIARVPPEDYIAAYERSRHQ